MNMCIYLLKDEPTINFASKEHLFPKGIGGITTLDKGMVSDEANNKFSILELEFMRKYAAVAFPRIFDGPGKRGSQSLNKNKQTNSDICVVEDFKTKKIKLGYIIKGNPNSIFQICINYDNNQSKIINCQILTKDRKNFQKKFNEFKIKYKTNKKNIIETNKINKNTFILGMDDKINFYLAYNPEFSNNKNGTLNIFKTIIQNLDFKSAKLSEKKIITKNPIYYPKFNYDYIKVNRVLFKIAYNIIAHKMGKKFILQNEFNELREFILNGKHYKKFNPQIIKSNSKIKFTKYQHAVIIHTHNKILKGNIYIYGIEYLLCFGVLLNENLNTFGRVCCWKEKKEYELIEYLNNFK